MVPLLSAADWCFLKPGMDAGRYYKQLAAAGYAAAEMVEPVNRPLAKAAGLRLLNYAGATNLNRAENKEAGIGELRQQLAGASAAGVEQLIVFSGNREGQPPEMGISNCIAVLKAVAAEAERVGVTLTFEPFNTFDHPGYDADHGEYAFAIARAVSSPAVKVLYDLYHMHRMGENVIEQAAANVEYIAHFHVAGSPGRDFPGPDQSLDYGLVVRTLHRCGYRGMWGMEFLPGMHGVKELEDAAKLFGIISADAETL